MTITAKLITDSSITIMMDGKTYILTEDNHQHYTKLRQALRENDISTVEQLIDMPKAINAFGQGAVTVHDGVVMYGDKPMHNALTTRMLRQMEEGFDIQPLIKFMENLMTNPSSVAREELYLWLEANNNPITDDGCFIGFKRVQLNYRDHYSGTIDNSVGQKPEMDRSQVDDNRMNTCSAGLHFAAESYLPHFHATDPGHTMVLKINPADVVSIPVDYSYAKGRCWKYEVIGEVDTGGFQKYYDTPIHGVDPSIDDEKSTDEKSTDEKSTDEKSTDDPDTMHYEVRCSYRDGETYTTEFSGTVLMDVIIIAHAAFEQYDVVTVVNVSTNTVEMTLTSDDDKEAQLPEVPVEQSTVKHQPIKPASTDNAPVIGDMLFTRIQACAILGVTSDVMTDMLSVGAVVERVARGGKNWVRIK